MDLPLEMPFVEAFTSEDDAFYAFARSRPRPLTLPADTYDTGAGVRTAARCCGNWTVRKAPLHASTAMLRNGQRVGERIPVDASRQRFFAGLETLPSAARAIRAPTAPEAVPSEELTAPGHEVRSRIEREVLARQARTAEP